ncbi:YoaK family protein [Leuconostocaceae bacterium ESL0958]|nr:YoaK family protein [Leuconostocaceae bacterium ESL0958]
MDQPNFPVHERLLFVCLLTMTAGALDAYSYLEHGAVFVGLQTGNLILLGIALGQGQFADVGPYLISLLSFGIGTLLVRILQHFLMTRTDQGALERRLVLLYMTGLLLLSAFLVGRTPNQVQTSILSFVAAAALQEFRTLKGERFMPLMMTGNFRTLYEALYDGFLRQDARRLAKGLDLAAAIGAFFAGAFFVGLLVPLLASYAVFVPALITVTMLFLLRKGKVA